MSPLDRVIETRPPDFSASQAVQIGRDRFALPAAAASNLGSERDQTFLLQAADGTGLAVMKVSNAAEDPATLDMEADAVLTWEDLL